MIFNYTECSACPHECTRRTFDRNVEYGKYHEPIYRTLQKFSLSTGKQGIISFWTLKGKLLRKIYVNNSDIDIAAFQVYFPSLEITIHRQRFDYTIDQVFISTSIGKLTTQANWLFQLFSELGGAAGLVLGISLITIVRQVDATITWLIRHFKLKLGYGKNHGPPTQCMKSHTLLNGTDLAIISLL